MLGVSPPQKGLAQDSGAVDKKSLQQQAELKKEFDQKLKEQLKERPQKSADSAKDSKPDRKPKLEQGDKEELRADKNQKKPSGGPKKKMVEPEEQNETTISNVMASIESEVEIADPRKDLAPVESKSSTEIKDSKVGLNPAAQAIGQQQTSGINPALEGKALSKGDTNTKVVEGEIAKSLPMDAMVAKALAAKSQGKATAVEITPEMIAAFRAAEANANTEAQPATDKADSKLDAQLALMMQQQSTAKATKATTETVAASGPSVDSSSLMAKSLENLKAMTAASAETPTPKAGPMAAAGIGAGLIAAGLQNSDELEANNVSENFQDVAGLKDFEDMQTAQAMQNISIERPQQNEQAQQPAELSFEQQLGAEVGFEPEANDGNDVSKSALLQKMKAFENEKGLTPKEANAFELKVLSLLQQERNELAHQKFGQGEGSGSGFSQQKEKQGESAMGDSMKELKAAALGTPDQAMHAGQTQADFRTHMNTPADRIAGAPLSPQAMAEHREENVQHLMTSAKFLAVKGGGEMVVKMSPDGMGPIALKVMMQDGKVNIEMQTQDKSVKKLIEDSLTELKSGLAAQKIHVDHVKIDTVNATNTENSAKFQSNQNSSDAQGRQQEFWKNFRDNFGNQSRRNSYGDVQAVPGRQSTAPDALKPVTTTAKARGEGRTGSTINRVA